VRPRRLSESAGTPVPSRSQPVAFRAVLLVLLVVAVGIAVGLALGGTFRNLSELRLRLWPLAILGLALQQVPIRSPDQHWLAVALLIASYVVLLVVVVVNLRVPGFRIIAVAFALNLVVVSVNGGMPVSAGAIRVAWGARGAGGLIEALERSGGEKHHLQRPDDILVPLSDVIGIGPPISQVVSPGDILFLIGVGWVLASATLGGRGRHARGHVPDVTRPVVDPGPATPASSLPPPPADPDPRSAPDPAST
jgi:hypothetical protein